MKEENKINRKRMVELLNEDLAREYQAVISYVIYSQTIKGAEFNYIAQELEKHAGEELQHALKIAKQIDYLNGEPINKPKEVKVSSKAKDMLKFDLENERVTIVNYRQRIRQADAMGEFALGEVLREIIAQEQEHLQDLADALGIDTQKSKSSRERERPPCRYSFSSGNCFTALSWRSGKRGITSKRVILDSLNSRLSTFCPARNLQLLTLNFFCDVSVGTTQKMSASEFVAWTQAQQTK